MLNPDYMVDVLGWSRQDGQCALWFSNRCGAWHCHVARERFLLWTDSESSRFQLSQHRDVAIRLDGVVPEESPLSYPKRQRTSLRAVS